MTNIADAIERIVHQLDAHSPDTRDQQLRIAMRALKCAAELGELADAISGWFGQNPRKGYTHTADHAIKEAFDTAITALVFAESVQPGAIRDRLPQHLTHLVDRADRYSSTVKEPARA